VILAVFLPSASLQKHRGYILIYRESSPQKIPWQGGRSRLQTISKKYYQILVRIPQSEKIIPEKSREELLTGELGLAG
jgi:hypothetical protein